MSFLMLFVPFVVLMLMMMMMMMTLNLPLTLLTWLSVMP